MGVPRISSSHLKDQSGLIPPPTLPPLAIGKAEAILVSIPVLRATFINASLMVSALGKRSAGVYCKAVLMTASNSGETLELMRRTGRSAKENGGSRRGSRRVMEWCKAAPREYISASGVASPRYCSGGEYPSVPIIVPFCPLWNVFAIPKSTSTTSPL